MSRLSLRLPMLLVLVALCGLAPVSRPAGNATLPAPPDPTAGKLEKAKATYQQKLARLKEDLLKDLDAKETQARAKGDKKVVDQVKAERAAFTEKGRLPKVVSTTGYENRSRQARAELEAVYESSIKELVRLKMDDRATALEKELAALRTGAAQDAGWIDLLAMVDVAKDNTGGRWVRDPEGLTIREGKFSGSIRVPYAPPDEYELHATARRVAGTGDFEIGPIWRGRRFYVVVDYRGTSGLSFLDGKLCTENETAFRSAIFRGAEPVDVVIKVKKASITASADGKMIVDYSGAPERLADAKPGGKHDVEPGVIFLSAVSDGSFKITSLRLKPLSGEGKSLR